VQTRNISVPMASLPNTQLRYPSPVPMAQAGVMAMVPTPPHQLPQHQLQQQQESQQQMLLAASQQQSQVQGQKTPPGQQAGNSTLDALDQTQDGLTASSESETSDCLFDSLEKTQAGVVTLSEFKRRSTCW